MTDEAPPLELREPSTNAWKDFRETLEKLTKSTLVLPYGVAGVTVELVEATGKGKNMTDKKEDRGPIHEVRAQIGPGDPRDPFNGGRLQVTGYEPAGRRRRHVCACGAQLSAPNES